VFFISAAIYFTGAILYAIFASGEVQPWAIQSNSTETPEAVKYEKEDNTNCDIKA
jgi:hypothetical protein